MHKGVILLVKAEDRDEARANAEEFMEAYRDQVWDWYVIGGRWTGLLTGYDPETDPKNTEECRLCGGTGKRPDMEVENGCNGCAGKGIAMKWPTDWAEHDGDIAPLGEVLAKVKKFAGDVDARIEAARKDAENYRIEGQRGMEGYMLSFVGNLLSEAFCFDANVYNVEQSGYLIPENPEGYYAVVVDMHN